MKTGNNTLSFMTKFKDGTPIDFVQKILSGSKTITLREDTFNRWTEVGQPILFATGVRTGNYQAFAKGEVLGITKVLLDIDAIRIASKQYNYYSITDKGILHSTHTIDMDIYTQLDGFNYAFVTGSDGFDSLNDFWNYWRSVANERKKHPQKFLIRKCIEFEVTEVIK